MATKPADQYSTKEATARFEAALKGAMHTPHKPLKSLKKTSAPNVAKKKSAKRRAATSR